MNYATSCNIETPFRGKMPLLRTLLAQRAKHGSALGARTLLAQRAKHGSALGARTLLAQRDKHGSTFGVRLVLAHAVKRPFNATLQTESFAAKIVGFNHTINRNQPINTETIAALQKTLR